MTGGTHQTLLDLYSEWGRLTDIEGAAIHGEEWPKVQHQQRLKRDLQDRIVQATQQWQNERAAAGTEPETVRASFERYFRPIVTDLIAREHRNNEALSQHRLVLQSKLATASQSAARLRGIQRSYVPERSSRWESYS